MTGHEIVNAAEVYIGQPIEIDMALIAINEAMSIIADMGLVYENIPFENVETNKWQILPNDYTHVLRVYDSDGNIFDGWEEIGGSIRFYEPGNYTVQARKIPNRMTNLNTELDINEGFHNSIVRFLRDFAMQAKSSDFASKTHNFNAFKEEVLKTHSYLNRRRQPKRIKVIRHA